MLKIGDIYPERADCTAVDCARIVNKHGNLFQFLMYLQDPSGNEIEQVTRGSIRYGLYTQSLAMFFVVHFDSLVLDSPINVHQVPAIISAGDVNHSNSASIILIKSTSNQIMAIRRLKLPDDMVSAILKGCKLQEQFLTEEETDVISHKIATKHSPVDMLKAAKASGEETGIVI